MRKIISSGDEAIADILQLDFNALKEKAKPKAIDYGPDGYIRWVPFGYDPELLNNISSIGEPDPFAFMSQVGAPQP